MKTFVAVKADLPQSSIGAPCGRWRRNASAFFGMRCTLRAAAAVRQTRKLLRGDRRPGAAPFQHTDARRAAWDCRFYKTPFSVSSKLQRAVAHFCLSARFEPSEGDIFFVVRELFHFRVGEMLVDMR